MNSESQKSGFDRLVAGLSSEERKAMLDRINQVAPDEFQIPEPENNEDKSSIRLSLRLKSESIFYRFIIWLRAFLSKERAEVIYNDDIINNLARKVNHNYPGLINPRINSLDYIFFERLKDLKAAADFFKPYFMYVNENPGDFYVFLSSFIVPELSEKINSEADAFNLSFDEEPSNEVRNGLMRKLDDVLKNMNPDYRSRIYQAVTAACWLEQFTEIPFIHFMSQFTNVSGDLYTSPFKNSQTDYNVLANVFSNIVMVQNEVVEALFLFSQKSGISKNTNSIDIERAVKEFMSKASSHFSAIKSFASGVPVIKIGKIINNDYDWIPGNIEGVESWFSLFKARWKKIIELRWQEWLRERKKHYLGRSLHDDFGLSDFPLMPNRPWLKVWSKNQFDSELTGGFLAWFVTEKFDEITQPLSDLIMEGIFIRNDNRTEYSEALNEFILANTEVRKLLDQLSASGEYGIFFDEVISQRTHTFQIQAQIDSLISYFEATVKKALKDFSDSVRKINAVFHGIFDDTKDGIHEGLQNLTTIKGRGNRQFRDDLCDIRDLLRKCNYYLAEFEPIDSALSV
ncbi:MAG: DUF5312 domain-containing protein [Treponema sp.]|nr:DUF5312 domain-containing protein [Treponema sp.]